MAEFVGKRLRITTDEGTYEGIVHSIDPVKLRLTLSKVLSCAEGKTPKRLHGFHNFFGHELNNLEVLKDEVSARDKESPKKEFNEEKEIGKKRENGFNSNNAQHHLNHESASTSNKTRKEASQKTSALQYSAKQQSPQQAAMSAVFKHAIKDIGMQMKRTTKPDNVVSRDASDEGTTMLQRPPLAPEKYLMDDYFSDEDFDELSPHNPPQTVLMQKYGDRYDNAIKYINSQRVVGVSCEGIKLGRHGAVCWLVIGCRQFTYLFDIMSLGAPCFEKGLGDILQNGNILKVIHDCRQISDALYHQFSVKIVNVFDTQVADIIIYQKEKGGQLPRVVNGLVGCLYEYLNLSPEECHFQKIRINHMQNDELIWSKRPLSQQLLDACAKHVMYLRELRLAQMERMLAEFIFGVNIYLGLVRDEKEYKLPDKKNMNKGRLVPRQFQELHRFHHRQRNRKFDEDVDDETNEAAGYLGDARNSSVWQEGQAFAEAYKDKHGRLREQSIRPDMFEGSGRSAYGGTATRPTDSGHRDERPDELSTGFFSNRPKMVTEGDSDGSGGSSSVSFGENMRSSYQDYSTTSSANTRSYPQLHGRCEKERINGPAGSAVEGPHVMRHGDGQEDNKNPFEFHFSSPEDLTGDLRSNSRPPCVLRDIPYSQPYANAVESTGNLVDQLNLTDEEFPPLSGSPHSDSSSSTPTKHKPSVGLRSGSRPGTTSTIRDNTRASPAVTRGQSPLQSPLARDPVGAVGRGRGSLFQHLSNMPHARLPRLEQVYGGASGGTGSTYGVGRAAHVFPTDDELFDSPEITRVSDPDLVRGGTRVWVRKT